MKKWLILLLALPFLITSCIKDTPQSSEADILAFSFPADSLLSLDVNIYNNYLIVYPKKGVHLEHAPFAIKISDGATYEKVGKKGNINDTLFFIKVISQDGNYSKTHAIMQMDSVILDFKFEVWTKYDYFENPKESFIQWFSSNNGAQMVLGNKPLYPLAKTTDAHSGNYAAKLQTIVGPGDILGMKYIPCLAGSLFLGGFDMTQGLQNPLHSTQFGIPYNGTKPVKFSGYYKYKEGDHDFINSDGSRDASRRDSCDIYAVLFKTDANNPFLYGDNVKNSPNIVAKAQIPSKAATAGNDFIFFEVDFNYDNYTTPFSHTDLQNGYYKMAIVCTSSTRGAYYEGRPGSCLVVDDLKIIAEEEK